jgi:hypothetical protein
VSGCHVQVNDDAQAICSSLFSTLFFFILYPSYSTFKISHSNPNSFKLSLDNQSVIIVRTSKQRFFIQHTTVLLLKLQEELELASRQVVTLFYDHHVVCHH